MPSNNSPPLKSSKSPERSWKQNIEHRISENTQTLGVINERTLWMMRLVLGLLVSILSGILIGALM